MAHGACSRTAACVGYNNLFSRLRTCAAAFPRPAHAFSHLAACPTQLQPEKLCLSVRLKA